MKMKVIMNKTIKSALLIIGLVLAGYGIFLLIQPETKVSIGDADLFSAQDNTNAYITLGIGIFAIVISALVKKK